MAEHPERIPVVVAEESDDVVRHVAQRIAAVMRERRTAGKPAVLGLATGDER